MQNKVTDKNSKELSDAAYDISKGKIKVDKPIAQKFKVLDVEDNKSNGMKAMAVKVMGNKILAK